MTGWVTIRCASAQALLALGVVALASCSGNNKLPIAATVPKAATPVPPKVVPPFAVTFVDVTSETGIAFKYEDDDERNMRAILETLGGGVGMFDFDGDALLDLCYAGGGHYGKEKQNPSGLPLACYRNRGDFKFENVTTAADLTAARFYSHAVHAADYDRDGFTDLLITGYGGLQLWRNQGDGTFQEVPAGSGLEQGKLWNTSAAWADFNADGELDLYVAAYVDWSPTNDPVCPSLHSHEVREICSPRMYNPQPDEIFLGSGDGTFRASAEACELKKYGNGLGVVAYDADNDGDIDIFVANDSVPKYFYVNDGRGLFEEVGGVRGCAFGYNGIAEGSMGVDILDVNHDCLTDVLVANFQDEFFALYRDEGKARYTQDSPGTGLIDVGDRQVCFGLHIADFDHDGDEDVFATNGHPLLFPKGLPRRQRPQILEWDEAFQVANTEASSYFTSTHDGRGIACGDLDGDGDLDTSVSQLSEPVVVLRTDVPAANHYLCVRLIGTRSPRIPFGARLILHTSQGDRLRHLRGGGGYLSTSAFDLHWGIPAGATADKLTIHWPSGQVQEVPVASLDQRLTIVEPIAASETP